MLDTTDTDVIPDIETAAETRDTDIKAATMIRDRTARTRDRTATTDTARITARNRRGRGRGERKGAGGVEKIKAPPAPFALPSFHISPCLPITLPIPYTITLRAFLLPYLATTILGITLSVCGLCTVWFGCGSVMIWLL